MIVGPYRLVKHGRASAKQAVENLKYKRIEPHLRLPRLAVLRC